MSDIDIFGPLINLAVGPSRAVESFLREWLDTYLAAYERDNGLPSHTYARPASWLKVNLLEGLPGEDMSPTLVIIARGSVGGPHRQNRSYDVPMGIGIAVITSSFEEDGAREVAGALGASILTSMFHKPNLRGVDYPNGRMGGRLRVLSWDDVRLDDLAGEESRTRAILRMEFTITVSAVLELNAGPDSPDPPDDDDGTHTPPGALPTVETTEVTVTKEDIS
jgi:hypothetical protein